MNDRKAALWSALTFLVIFAAALFVGWLLLGVTFE